MKWLNSYINIAKLGGGIWLIGALWLRPDLHHDEWARLLLMLAALVWVPLGLHLLHYPTRFAWIVAAAAWALVVSMTLPAGIAAGLLSAGWLAVSLGVFRKGIDHLFVAPRHAGSLAVASAQIFLVVGSIWTTADRLGLRPLDFDPAIVLLTGVHFHYAGFLFTLLTGLLYQHWPTPSQKLAAYLAVLAVPLTAVGITLSQSNGYFGLEATAAAVVALSGWLCGWGYLRTALNPNRSNSTRILWAIAGLSLFFTMTLALGYALRPYYSIVWLQIPTMRAWHGSINALGVAGCGVLGWIFNKNK